MDEQPTTLTQACAPVFLHLTTFRRNSATSTLTIQQLQTALRSEIDRVRTRCEQDRRLGPLFERAFYALVATADQVVLSSSWPQRAGWSMQLLETHYFGRAEGGKQFYRLVDEVLEDPTDAGAEVAELLFTCMGLGFQGELLGERSELERRRRQLFEKARLPGRLGETLTPDAYGRNSDKGMSKLPTVGIARLVAVAIAALLFAILSGKTFTSRKLLDDRTQIRTIVEKLESADQSPR